MLVTPLGERLPLTTMTSLVVRKSQTSVAPLFKLRLAMARLPAAPAPAGMIRLPLPAVTVPSTVPIPANVWPLARVIPAAETSNVPALPMDIVFEPAREPPMSNASVPPPTDKVPVKLAAVPRCTNVPVFVKDNVPDPARGLALVRNIPDGMSNQPPLAPIVMPLLELVKAKLAVG